jgi:hypothetical protein
MKYQVTYAVDGTTALKAHAPRTRSANHGHIIPFPGNPRPSTSREERRREARRRDLAQQELVTVEEVPFGTDYIPARHLFYWMTDETPAQLRAKHAPKLSGRQRFVYYYADKVHNAVVNYPFALQLRFGTPGAYAQEKPSALQTLFFMACSCAFAVLLALLGH